MASLMALSCKILSGIWLRRRGVRRWGLATSADISSRLVSSADGVPRCSASACAVLRPINLRLGVLLGVDEHDGEGGCSGAGSNAPGMRGRSSPSIIEFVGNVEWWTLVEVVVYESI